ncbi:MAG TPA: flagellar brake protein [Paucimonas sp.]|nr:flagellar brake protein [Paucimonas sp.]
MSDSPAPTFDDMKLQVGERLQVSLRRNPKTMYYPTLIGYVRGEYLLLKLPLDHGLAVPMLEGEEVVVRVFSGVAVFAFDSVVDSLQLNPRYQMYLRFPTAIQAIPLRESPRVSVNLPVRIRTVSHSEPISALLTDLSLSGGLITADSNFGKPGDVIAIAFSFRIRPTGQEVHIATHATIRSCQQLHGNLPARQYGTITFSCGIGIQFDGISPEDQVMLQHFLYEQMI